MIQKMLLVCAVCGLFIPLHSASAANELNVVVILDNSGSMNQVMNRGNTRIVAAKQAMWRVLSQAPEDAQIGVVLLNPVRNQKWAVPLGPVEPSVAQEAVESLQAAGNTPLGATMKEAADALLELRDKQKYGTYKLLIISDGEATDRALVEQYLPQIQARGILVDVIGVSMGQQHSLATRTATYRNADDPASLEKAISQVVLGESSTDTDDNTGQSDFDLLASVPSEVAAVSLEALTTPHNEPIGAFAGDPVAGLPNSYQPPQPANAPNNGSNRGGGPGFGTFLMIGFVILILFRVFASIVKAR
ncbi:vWA domain-containing protein [Bremerella sp. JC817]|uniref:vWA domain-containing protein n=1 Tax=Bremerella sp. JC817 TaxID=3231756 RepID=UPI00345A1560